MPPVNANNSFLSSKTNFMTKLQIISAKAKVLPTLPAQVWQFFVLRITSSSLILLSASCGCYGCSANNFSKAKDENAVKVFPS
jgi:hypothetical protein